MNYNEIIKMLEEVKLQNETYYDLMRETVWKLWKEQDDSLLSKIRQIEKLQDDMVDEMYRQSTKYGEPPKVA